MMPSRLTRPDGRLQADQARDRRRADDAAVGLGADADRGEARRDRRAGAGSWSRRDCDRARRDCFVCPPRPLQPDVERVERKLAHSLRLVLPRITAPAARRRCTRKASRWRLVVGERERAGRVDHRRRVDVVLQQHRDAVQRAAHACRPCVRRRARRLRSSASGLSSMTALSVGPGLVDRGDAIEVGLRQRDGCRARPSPCALQVGDVGFVEGRTRRRSRPGALQRCRRRRDARLRRASRGWQAVVRARRGRAGQGAWHRSPGRMCRRSMRRSGRDRGNRRGAVSGGA